MRRIGPAGRGRRVSPTAASASAPAFAPSDIADLFAWYRGDLGITLNGSNVSAWADQTAPAVDASQGVAGNQPPWVEAGAIFNGNSYVGPLDGTADRLTAGAAADWEFLHDGAGVTICGVFYTGALGATRRLFDTNNGSTTALGITSYLSSATPAVLTFAIGNGASNVCVASTAASINTLSTYGFIFRHATASSPDYSLFINGVTTTGNNTNAPAGGAPGGPLYIGGRSSGTQLFNGGLAEIMIWDRYIDDAEQTQVSDYVVERYF